MDPFRQPRPGLFFRKYLPFVLLLLIAFAGYWQIAWMQYCLKYDMMDQAYQWRYFVGECLQNGFLPLWNPYQNLGYPMHADPQGTAWYPVTWLIGFFGGYNPFSLSFDFILHVFFAGTGMYALGKKLGFQQWIAFMVSVAFMLSGFFIGNAQHFSWIASGTWIPFILAFFIDLNKNKKRISAGLTGFFMFMLVTGGYPAFVIITGYLILTLIIWFVLNEYRMKGRKAAWLMVRLNLLWIGFAIALSAVYIISILNVIPFIHRTEGLDYSIIVFNPFSPQCMLSFITPFATVRDPGFFDTDISMANGYFGIILLIMFIYSLFVKKPVVFRIFFWFGMVSLLAAMGGYLPVRKVLYDYVPFMNLFRFPSLLRYFALLSFIVMAGFSFNKLIREGRRFTALKAVTGVILGILCLALFITWFRLRGINDLQPVTLFTENTSASWFQHFYLQLFIQIVLVTLLLLSFFIFKRKTLFYYIIFISVMDLFIAAQLNAPFSVYSEKYTTRDVYEHTRLFSPSFPVPSRKPVIENTDKRSGISYGPLWKNLSIFRKEIAHDGYNPFLIYRYDSIRDSMPEFHRYLLSNPPAFLARQIRSIDSLGGDLHNNKRLVSGEAYLINQDFQDVNKFEEISNPEDTLWFRFFSPNRMIFTTHTANYRMLILLQNYYRGWHVKIDDHPANLYISDMTLLSTFVPPGTHTVSFIFRPLAVIIGLMITIVALFCWIIFMMRWKGDIRGEL